MTKEQKRYIYASEADVLNVEMVKDGLSQSERLEKLNDVAKRQLSLLLDDKFNKVVVYQKEKQV